MRTLKLPNKPLKQTSHSKTQSARVLSGIALGRFGRAAEALWLAAERRSVRRQSLRFDPREMVNVAKPLAAAFFFACAYPLQPALCDSIEIRGDETFVARTQDALRLLETRAPSSFELVCRHLGAISSGDRSGLNTARGPLPSFEVGPLTVQSSATWYAGAIVHDSYHAKLFLSYLRRQGRPVPSDEWTGTGPEREAIAHQLTALRAIGAPAEEIDHLLGFDGTHHDVDGDGFYSPRDYQNRSW